MHWLDNEVVKGVQDYELPNGIEFHFHPLMFIGATLQRDQSELGIITSYQVKE